SREPARAEVCAPALHGALPILAAGIGATLWQADAARRAAERALTQERRATAARDFMVQLFEANDPDAAIDGPLTARDLLDQGAQDRKSTRLNSSHVKISYAVVC